METFVYNSRFHKKPTNILLGKNKKPTNLQFGSQVTSIFWVSSNLYLCKKVHVNQISEEESYI